MKKSLLRASSLGVVAVLLGAAGSAYGLGEVLSQTKEELRLKYDVTVQEHRTGRVTIVLTLADEGRLKPLDEVQLVVPAEEQDKDGGRWMDLAVSMEMVKGADGRRVGRAHLLKSLAERAEIHFNSHKMDGKELPLTYFVHVIPMKKYLEKGAAPKE